MAASIASGRRGDHPEAAECQHARGDEADRSDARALKRDSSRRRDDRHEGVPAGDFIERAVGNVQRALLEGGVLVAVVLFLFLWNFRTTFISLTAIPLSLVTAIIAMGYFGIGSTR